MHGDSDYTQLSWCTQIVHIVYVSMNTVYGVALVVCVQPELQEIYALIGVGRVGQGAAQKLEHLGT